MHKERRYEGTLDSRGEHTFAKTNWAALVELPDHGDAITLSVTVKGTGFHSDG
jgi:hypothetical protein